ncbi:MAG: hypothetical protein BroJett014_03840 [Planctomycetota bacterium]|nr:MAG: hypothetical protein BroJett014_03840 [Planctomycetota bacterium]
MGEGREVAREARGDGGRREVVAEPVSAVPVERVRVVRSSPPSARGCLALVVLGLTVGTAVWLWLRHEVVFPAELRLGVQVYATFYRDLSIAAVALIGLSWLWALRWRSDSVMRSRAILATAAVTVAAVFLAWLWTQVRFEPEARDRQLKELATWGTALLTVAVLFKLLRPWPSSRRVIDVEAEDA